MNSAVYFSTLINEKVLWIKMINQIHHDYCINWTCHYVSNLLIRFIDIAELILFQKVAKRTTVLTNKILFYRNAGIVALRPNCAYVQADPSLPSPHMLEWPFCMMHYIYLRRKNSFQNEPWINHGIRIKYKRKISNVINFIISKGIK